MIINILVVIKILINILQGFHLKHKRKRDTTKNISININNCDWKQVELLFIFLIKDTFVAYKTKIVFINYKQFILKRRTFVMNN